MAIKTVSLLEEFDNDVQHADVKNFGKKLKLFSDSNVTEDDKYGRQSLYNGNINTAGLSLEFNQNTFNQCLFEMSQPYHTGINGTPAVETEYRSMKLTYEDLAKNIILDTKAYLNTRNNLGNFNLCAIVFDDYFFSGNKTFANNVIISSSLSVGEDVDITRNMSITGDTVIYNSLHVGKDISSDRALYTGTLSSDLSGTTVNPGVNGFIVNGILTATSAYVKIKPSLIVDDYLSVNNTIYGTSGITVSGGFHIYGNSNIDGDLDLSTHSISAGNCTLTASAARWSDLAEYYLADGTYDPGTLMQFGGVNEVTVAKNSVNAVVTSKPGYLMNAGLKDDPYGCPLALAGRVPVKVIGKVKKFDKITLSRHEGIGEAKKWYQLNKTHVGISLEDNFDDGIKLVECLVKLSV